MEDHCVFKLRNHNRCYGATITALCNKGSLVGPATLERVEDSTTGRNKKQRSLGHGSEIIDIFSVAYGWDSQFQINLT